jgi:putative ABC transport system ATP-binding protein
MMVVAEDLEKWYPSGGRRLAVLREIDLAVAAGEFVAIIGPSGSGKTTLLGLLAGLDHPSSGAVRLDGQDLGSLTEDGRARLRAEKIGFVFQTFHLLPTLTALENVLVPLEILGGGRRGRGNGAGEAAMRHGGGSGRLSAAAMRERAVGLLDRVGLGDRLDHYPTQLSGGEQQRVALARAFANEPRILFADEPTGNLDAETGRGVIDLLFELNRESGVTVVLVTHDPELAARAGRVVRLAGGRIVEDRRLEHGAALAGADSSRPERDGARSEGEPLPPEGADTRPAADGSRRVGA